MIKSKRLLILSGLVLALPGCGQAREILKTLVPAGSVALEAAKITSSITTIRDDYIVTRDKVLEHKDIFTDEEWWELDQGNALLVEAYLKVKSYREQSSDPAKLVLTTYELSEIARPVRDATAKMIVVMDLHISEMSIDAQIAYRDASRSYESIDHYIRRMINEKDVQVKAEMIKRILRIAAQVIGVAKIALEARADV